MPDVAAAIHNSNLKDFYERMNQNRTFKTKQGIIAVMRKQIILMFTLWKKEERCIAEYLAGIKIGWYPYVAAVQPGNLGVGSSTGDGFDSPI